MAMSHLASASTILNMEHFVSLLVSKVTKSMGQILGLVLLLETGQMMHSLFAKVTMRRQLLAYWFSISIKLLVADFF